MLARLCILSFLSSKYINYNKGKMIFVFLWTLKKKNIDSSTAAGFVTKLYHYYLAYIRYTFMFLSL